MAKIGLRNVIGNTISGRSTPRPPINRNYLLWKSGSTNQILISNANSNKLLWKATTP